MNEIILNKDGIVGKMNAIKAFQEIVKNQLIPNEDFGVVTGISKPFLFKPGAEKILSILGIQYENPNIIEIWEKRLINDTEIQYYEVTIKILGIANGQVVGIGVGSCNTLETKYCHTYMDGEKTFITDDQHYYNIKNTIMKMAKKRAIVDLALMIGSLSNIFTQDEDLVVPDKIEKPPTKKQLDYLYQLANEFPDYIEKVLELAKGIMEKGKIIIKGSSQDVSAAIDYLKKIKENNEEN